MTSLLTQLRMASVLRAQQCADSGVPLADIRAISGIEPYDRWRELVPYARALTTLKQIEVTRANAE